MSFISVREAYDLDLDSSDHLFRSSPVSQNWPFAGTGHSRMRLEGADSDSQPGIVRCTPLRDQKLVTRLARPFRPLTLPRAGHKAAWIPPRKVVIQSSQNSHMKEKMLGEKRRSNPDARASPH